MKKIYNLTLLIILITSCNSLPKNYVIPYILSIDVENSINSNIKDIDKKNISFYLEILPENQYKIHLLKYKINESYSFSNRKIFINDRFFPLIFDLDYKFHVKMIDYYPIVSKFTDESERNLTTFKMPTTEERFINKSLYIKDRILPRFEMTTFWIFDNSGKLLETNSK